MRMIATMIMAVLTLGGTIYAVQYGADVFERVSK